MFAYSSVLTHTLNKLSAQFLALVQFMLEKTIRPTLQGKYFLVKRLQNPYYCSLDTTSNRRISHRIRRQPPMTRARMRAEKRAGIGAIAKRATEIHASLTRHSSGFLCHKWASVKTVEYATLISAQIVQTPQSCGCIYTPKFIFISHQQ